MIKQMMNELIDLLEEDSSNFKQVEPYEGQFENLQNAIIKPPSVLIEIEAGNNSETRDRAITSQINLFLTTSHIKTNVPGNMLDIIDHLVDEYHGKTIISSSSRIGTLIFKSYQRVALYKGFIVYRLTFDFKPRS